MSVSSGKIKSYKLYKTSSTLKKPISDATHTLSEISFLVLRLQTESGITGESYLLSFQYSAHAIRGAFKDLLPSIKGYEVNQTGKVFAQLDHLSEYFGNQGINRWVQAAVNVAMWDAWGKMLGQPLWKVWGAHRDSCNIYGSGGWLSYSIDELINEVTGYARRGFKAVKIKVGSSNVRTDVERLKQVRKVVGNDIDIMIDANQGLDLASAVQLSDAVHPLNIFWFEEPLHHHNYDGYQALKKQSRISLAMGEREYDTVSLTQLLQRSAIDIWQPDLLRIGGVETWRESAALAASYHVPVLPHYYKDYDVALVCSIPNGVGVESFDWIDPLIDEPLIIRDGLVQPRTGPGWGFQFRDEFLQEISLG